MGNLPIYAVQGERMRKEVPGRLHPSYPENFVWPDYMIEKKKKTD